MKFSEQWLRDWIDPVADTGELAHRLTMAGLEVDAIEPVAGVFSGVVVGEITAAEPHPDADKLRVCQVDDGSEAALQVVCGAPNARVGLKAPFARVGAVLPGDFKIKQAKLRGVESRGMLCAAAELRLSEQADGLLELPADAPVGADLRTWLGLDDVTIELGLTPNRADCLSIAGIAREVSVLTDAPLRGPAIEPVAATCDDTLDVNLAAGEECPHYVGRVIRGVDLSRPTPLWMAERLRRSGIRCIDPVVDITNYVLLELGQPLHAFDLALLRGGIRVRHAVAGETLTLLDGQSIELAADDLVIADAERAVALAGIMGGADTAVGPETRDIFLESAFFSPLHLAGRARHYGLHTDSSHRFERGVDWQLQARAVERATALILEIVGGRPGPLCESALPEALPRTASIHLRRERIGRVLGLELPDTEVAETLSRLGLKAEPTPAGWEVQAPSWRFDLAIEADLLEELARVHGYNRLPVRHLDTELDFRPRPEADTGSAVLRQVLVARGYREAITYSFVEPALQRALAPAVEAVALANPISADMAVMRSTLWAGLLGTARHNFNRQQGRLRLFETGLRFLPDPEGLQQTPSLALLLSGRRAPENWADPAAEVDFFDLKGDLEALLERAGVGAECSFRAAEHPALHPGQCAAVYRDGRCVGYLGRLHPQVQRELDLPQSVLLAELDLAAFQDATLPRFRELSRFPEVRRDLALLVPRDLAAGDVMDAIREQAGDYLRDLRLFDIYEGKGVDKQRKSLGFGLTFQHSSRTLNDDEINAAVDAVVAHLTDRFEATLRN